MRFSSTLFLYIARQFFMNFLMVLGTLLTVSYIFDSVELTRRLAKRTDIDFSLIAQMGFFKLPEVGQELFPFAVLFSAIFTFWRLTRSNELVIVRASGVSAWQFLFPTIFLAFVIGTAKIGAINPASAMMLAKFEQMEATYLRGQKNAINLSNSGLWLKQPLQDGQAILHASNVDNKNWSLNNVIVYFFDNDMNMIRRLDAEKAYLKPGYWEIRNGWANTTTQANVPATPVEQTRMPTSLTPEEIESSFSSPETISFWELQNYIRIMQETGLSPIKLRMHYYTLLFEPLLYTALVLLAAALALRPPRQMKSWNIVLGSLGIAFLVFFLGDVLHALGISEALPLLAAASAPAIISMLLGVTAILHLEDG